MMTQLSADILSIMSQGEKSAEIIRQVLFELPGFNAHHLFTEIRNSARSFLKKERSLELKDNLKKEYSIEPLHGLDEKSLNVYFKLNLQTATLKGELTERQCAFLVNLMSDTHQTEVSYE